MAQPQLNINTASEEELREFDNIGEGRARSILDKQIETGGNITEDVLKEMSSIPTSVWQPLVAGGQWIFKEAEIKQKEEFDVAPSDKELLEREKIKHYYQKELIEQECKFKLEKAALELEIAKQKWLLIVNKGEATSQPVAGRVGETSTSPGGDTAHSTPGTTTSNTHTHPVSLPMVTGGGNEPLYSYCSAQHQIAPTQTCTMTALHSTPIARTSLSAAMAHGNQADVITAISSVAPNGYYGNPPPGFPFHPSIPPALVHQPYLAALPPLGLAQHGGTAHVPSVPPNDLLRNSFDDDCNGEQLRDFRKDERTGGHSTFRHHTASTKLATYNGKNEWHPFELQFERIAKRHFWSKEEMADKLVELLRDKALKYFSVQSRTIQESYILMRDKFRQRFGHKDEPVTIRRQIQHLKQNEDELLEEFAERTHSLATDGYPATASDTVETIATDAFLKGCSDKRAALTAMDKQPVNLDGALQMMKTILVTSASF